MPVRPFDAGWFAALDLVLRADPEYAIVSRYFDRRVAFVSGGETAVVRFCRGGVAEYASGAGDADFGFGAEPEVWERFLLPLPPPLYQDLFALVARARGFRVFGDELAFMQNVRAVQRAMRLFREVRT